MSDRNSFFSEVGERWRVTQDIIPDDTGGI